MLPAKAFRVLALRHAAPLFGSGSASRRMVNA